MNKISKALSRARQENEERKREEAQGQDLGGIKSPRPTLQQTAVQFPDPRQQERARVLSQVRDQQVLDAYNLLRTQVLHKTVGKDLNTIMITSPGPGEGKTTTAINLGLSIARNEQYTALVVDTHLRSPKVHSYLGLECAQGVTDFILDGVAIPELLVAPNEKRFVVLPSGRQLQSSTDILSSKAMQELVQELKSRYPDRYVLFDCPHLLNMPDSLVFSSYVDAVLLVVEVDRTRRDDVQKALAILEERNVLGLVLNKGQ